MKWDDLVRSRERDAILILKIQLSHALFAIHIIAVQAAAENTSCPHSAGVPGVPLPSYNKIRMLPMIRASTTVECSA